MSASGHPSSGFSGVRRRIPRYSVAIPIDITVLRSGAPASIPGRSLDLGEGGVAAVLAAELQLGEWVAVEFQLPNAGQALQTGDQGIFMGPAQHHPSRDPAASPSAEPRKRIA